MAEDKDRYGSTKIEIEEVIGTLKKRKNEKFDFLEKKKQREENELIEKIDKLLNLIEASDEDPVYDIARDISRKLDIIMNKLDGIISRLDSIMKGESPPTGELEGDLKKVALEIEILSPGEKITLKTLAERAGLDEKHVLEIVKELRSRGFNIEIVEEEKKRGIFSKKVTSIIKR